MGIQNTFQGLGLEEKEAKIYLALLELGDGTVLQASRKSGIKRPTAYLVLRSLEEKGFISRVFQGKKTVYSPQHPQKLITETELRLKELRETVPQLETLMQKEGKPRVTIYEGKGQLDRAYDEAFLAKGEILFISNSQVSLEIFAKSFSKLQYKTFSPEFRFREIVDEGQESRAYAQKVSGPYREIRFIPKELLPFETDIGIFGNNTLITSVKKEYFTIRIESEEIARAFRTIFELMWRATKQL
jgi:sugar-specific transcriptional regulator TrmB